MRMDEYDNLNNLPWHLHMGIMLARAFVAPLLFVLIAGCAIIEQLTGEE